MRGHDAPIDANASPHLFRKTAVHPASNSLTRSKDSVDLETRSASSLLLSQRSSVVGGGGGRPKNPVLDKVRRASIQERQLSSRASSRSSMLSSEAIIEESETSGGAPASVATAETTQSTSLPRSRRQSQGGMGRRLDGRSTEDVLALTSNRRLGGSATISARSSASPSLPRVLSGEGTSMILLTQLRAEMGSRGGPTAGLSQDEMARVTAILFEQPATQHGERRRTQSMVASTEDMARMQMNAAVRGGGRRKSLPNRSLVYGGSVELPRPPPPPPLPNKTARRAGDLPLESIDDYINKDGFVPVGVLPASGPAVPSRDGSAKGSTKSGRRRSMSTTGVHREDGGGGGDVELVVMRKSGSGASLGIVERRTTARSSIAKPRMELTRLELSTPSSSPVVEAVAVSEGAEKEEGRKSGKEELEEDRGCRCASSCLIV
ncbi:hypothetical protein HDU96_003213 [Phlyctochytrium bullatum]|nr:hypothetical protein HDU96_003213 [Phlyctochytrium bullatum]